jgi:hypothetical protein
MEARRGAGGPAAALLRGLSHQQVPVLTGIDRDGRCVDRRMDRRSTDEVVAALGPGRVNQHHETMKTHINHVLRGVSTQHLPDYLAMLRLVNRPPPDPGETLRAAFVAG